MKKFLAILLALTLTLGLAVTAFAADTTTTGTITVKNVGDATTLDVYQILTYTLNADGKTYSSVTFNPGYKAAFITAVNATLAEGATPFADTVSDNALLVYISNNLNNTTFAAALAKELDKVLASSNIVDSKTATDAASDTGTWTSEAVALGYYLVKDTTSAKENEQYTSVLMLTPLKPNANITLKSTSFTTPVKTADHTTGVKVGDKINYTVSLDIPNYSENTTMTVKFVDTLGIGLADPTITTVTLDGAAVDSGKYIATTADGTDTDAGKLVFTVDFGDVMAKFPDSIGKKLVVNYTATVTKDAPGAGLVNSVIAVENNVKSVVKSTTTYTYGFDATKKNENQETLSGVEFKVYQNKDESGAPIYLNFTKDDTTGVYNYNAAGTATITTGSNGYLKVWGLDQGTYYLEETKPLAGYNNLAAPIPVTIDGKAASTTVGVGNIVNYTGVELPSTGGMGTTIFTICGMLILMTSGLFLALNRKRLFNK